jgi:hypothetical protein
MASVLKFDAVQNELCQDSKILVNSHKTQTGMNNTSTTATDTVFIGMPVCLRDTLRAEG